MAAINKFQLKEVKREVFYQIKRIIKDMQLSSKCPPGMRKSKQRLVFLLHILNQLERDGILELHEGAIYEGHVEISKGGMLYADGASEDVS